MTGFLLKILLGITGMAILGFDLFSPLIARAALDNDGQNLLRESRNAYKATAQNEQATRHKLEQSLEGTGIRLVDFTISAPSFEAQGQTSRTIRLTIEREAKGILLNRISAFSNYYEVQVVVETKSDK